MVNDARDQGNTGGTTRFTSREKARVLRRAGLEEAARRQETGGIDVPDDVIARSSACFGLADAMQMIAEELRKPCWSVMIRTADGSSDTVQVKAASQLDAAFQAGKWRCRSNELISVEPAAQAGYRGRRQCPARFRAA
jgi:hypothetical protein